MRTGSTTVAAALAVVVAAALGGTAAPPAAAPPDAPPVALHAAPAASVTCSSTPFRSDPRAKVWFRIPALVRTDAGTLVAFAEKRDRMDSDDGNFDVVTARSTDHGCTWGAWRTIGNDAANRVSNPVPVYDTVTDTVLVLSVVTPRPGSGGRGKGLYLQTSTDDGRTFTPLLARNLRPTGTKGGLTGPGHGIQLRAGEPGRLLVPMGYRTSSGFYGAYGIYSDDHGATWQVGYDQQDRTGDVDFIEGSVAELASGRLYITYRLRKDLATAGTARKHAWSTDGGASLHSAFGWHPLKIVSVQTPVLGLTGTHAGLLLLSAPADRTRNLRRDMTVFVSRTDGATWSRRYPVELESRPGSYSDLVQVDDATIGILYETGTVTWKERIAYRRIPITQLSDPTKVPSTVTATHRDSLPATEGLRVMTTTRVAGISSPPGRVTVTLSNSSRTVRASVTLTYSNRGVRLVTLPRAPRGRYRVSVTYGGTIRITGDRYDAGTVTIT